MKKINIPVGQFTPVEPYILNCINSAIFFTPDKEINHNS